MVLVEIVAHRDQKKLHSDLIQASAYDPAILSVLLHYPEDAFRLDRPVHSKERPVGTVQILQHFPVYGCELSVHTDRLVPFALLTSLGIRTAPFCTHCGKS